MVSFLITLLNPFLVSFLAALGITLLLWRKRLIPQRQLIALSAAMLVLTLSCTPAVMYFALGSLEWPFTPRNRCPQDIRTIVVLGGYVIPPDESSESAQLGIDSLYRCLMAAQLYRDSGPCLILLSGGKVDPAVAGPTIAQAMKEFLVQYGVPASDIVTEEKSTNTYENAFYSAQILAERQIDSVVLVTDATHLKRACWCFEAQGIHPIACGVLFHSRDFDWELKSFLPNPIAALDLQRVLHEWLGIAWYWSQGRFALHPSALPAVH